jgi:hypothetical protein
MTKLCAVLSAATAGMAALFYLSRRPPQPSDGRPAATDQLLRLIRSELQAQRRPLNQHRGTLNDAHKHILAVSKGLAKPAR